MEKDIKLVKNIPGIEEYTNKPKLNFGWQITSTDAILNLGAMKNAVVIRKSIHGSIFISEASFFWFPNEYYKMRFNDMEKAVKVANNHVKKWLESCNDALGI